MPSTMYEFPVHRSSASQKPPGLTRAPDVAFWPRWVLACQLPQFNDGPERVTNTLELTCAMQALAKLFKFPTKEIRHARARQPIRSQHPDECSLRSGEG